MTNTNATTTPPRQHGDEARLFAELNDRLFHSVRHAVGASDALIEDACSFAWIQLLRHQPRRETALAWLKVVAIREAWTLSRREHRELSTDAMLDNDIDGDTFVDTIPGVDLDLTLEAREALRTVATLRPLHRRTFARHVAGLNYEEIARETNQSWRQVERHLRRSRSALRDGGENAPAAA